MDPVQNPFTPNAGAEPELIVGRDDQLTSFDILLNRLISGRTEQSMIITGLRGVGKTVLLGQFRTKALRAGWAVVEPARTADVPSRLVGARGDRHAVLGEHPADRLDPELVPDLVDERGHHGSRGSSSRATNEDAASRISLARFSSVTSRSRSLIRLASLVVVPADSPAECPGRPRL